MQYAAACEACACEACACKACREIFKSMIRRKNPMRAHTIVAALMLGLTSMLGLRLASAQDYPTRPITMIVPFPAGGPTDTVARVTAQEMSKLLGQQKTEEHTSELQSHSDLVCRLLLEKK